MPTCYECLKKLPGECICPIPPEEKLEQWIDAAVREVRIIQALIRGEYEPRVEAYLFKLEDSLTYRISEAVRVRCKVESVKIKKQHEFSWKIIAKIRIPDDGNLLEAILYDVEGKPLYRHVLVGRFLGADLAEIYWGLEVGEGRT